MVDLVPTGFQYTAFRHRSNGGVATATTPSRQLRNPKPSKKKKGEKFLRAEKVLVEAAAARENRWLLHDDVSEGDC